MHAFCCYIFAARIACDSGPTCYTLTWHEKCKLKYDKNVRGTSWPHFSVMAQVDQSRTHLARADPVIMIPQLTAIISSH